MKNYAKMEPVFIDKAHEIFYRDQMKKVKDDVYHRALFYALGINEDIRQHIDDVYDFQEHLIIPDAVHRAWQTSGSLKATRIAFNLYANCVPEGNTDAAETLNEAIDEANTITAYTVEEIFDCPYAPFFWQAIQLRYPEFAVYRKDPLESLFEKQQEEHVHHNDVDKSNKSHSNKSAVFRYYSVLRPVASDSVPKAAEATKIWNFDKKTFCQEINMEAYGYIEYSNPLSVRECAAFDLIEAFELVEAVMLTYWCVETKFFKDGHVDSIIASSREAFKKPENTHIDMDEYDLYKDWFDSLIEAEEYTNSARKA